MLSTKLNSEPQEDNTMKVFLKKYNSSLCLNREYLKYMFSKNMLKIQENYIRSSFVGKKFIKIEQELTLE